MIPADIEQDVVRRIRRVMPDVERVLMFGSQARGEARPDSDVDLIVVGRIDTDRWQLTGQILLALRHMRFAFDVVLMSPAEFAEFKVSPAYWPRAVLREAVELHAAP